jgi:glutaminase
MVPFAVSVASFRDRRFRHAEPPDQEVATLIAEAYERYKSLDEGKVADYIPALARTPRKLFGVCVVGIGGRVFAVGDTEHEYSIQSVSKPFVLALVSQAVRLRRRRAAVRSPAG